MTQLFPFFFHVFVSVFVFLFVLVWYGGRDIVVRNAGEWTSLGCGLSPEDELEVPDLHSDTCGPPVFSEFLPGAPALVWTSWTSERLQDGLADGATATGGAGLRKLLLIPF